MSAFQVQAKKRPIVDPAKLAAFAAGADVADTGAQKAVEERQLDDKRRSYVFNLRFTEREMHELEAKTVDTPDSKHAYLIRLFRESVGMR